MNSKKQMTFNFNREEGNLSDNILPPMGLRRAVLGWLIPQNPTGIGVLVPTRILRFQADVAAFWSLPNKKKGKHLSPCKTTIVEIRNDREHCWPDCSKHEELLRLLKEKKEMRKSLEASIRKNEPGLKDNDNLFNEYESWHYEESRNKNYHKCCRQIEEMEHSLYRGSRFEQIRRAHVADYLYLAVPAGTVHPYELADGWGLIEVYPDMKTALIKNAENWNCPEANRIHLIQNIAMACKKSLLFSHGIYENAKGSPVFSPVPRRRRFAERI